MINPSASQPIDRQRLDRVLTFAALLFTLALAGCDQKRETTASAADGGPVSQTQPQVNKDNAVELLFSYGSEKQRWVDDVTASFNAQRYKVASGKVIRVKAVPLGSGESMEDLLSGRTHAHLWSPASEVFVTLANARSAAAAGGPLVGPTQDLVLSPVVIAMWKPMAESLGWPNKPVGWADILALAKDQRGWASYGHPEFGPFKFGHTHPEYSNSGLISILAETYAATGKARGIEPSDLDDPKVGQYLEDVEKSVVHYGRSTGFFGRRLFEDGPRYLSAAVVYENMVVESYSQQMPMPLVAIYPKEGTFWSDHPVGIVEREWVDAEHREAAKFYIDFLRGPPQQAQALAYGFRPAEGDVSAPVDAAHGVDPHQPTTVLELPSAATIDRTIELWRRHKKPSTVMIVFDKSGSMHDDNKIASAQAGALQLVEMLAARDAVGLVPFSSDVTVVPPVMLQGGRTQVEARINALFPDGNTRLYEAIAAARDSLGSPPPKDRICAVVVLTDGEDNGNRLSLDQLLDRRAGRRPRLHDRLRQLRPARRSETDLATDPGGILRRHATEHSCGVSGHRDVFLNGSIYAVPAMPNG